MRFPNKTEIERVVGKIKKEKIKGTLGLNENPSPLERFRWDLCQKFIKYKKVHGLNQKQLAELLEVDEAKVSKILHHRIHEFSTDRLIALYSKLDPDIRLKVG